MTLEKTLIGVGLVLIPFGLMVNPVWAAAGIGMIMWAEG